MAPPSVEIAVFNTGALLIEAQGQPPLRLSPDQARDLMAFLRRTAASTPELQ